MRTGDLLVVNGENSWVKGRYTSGLVLKEFTSSVKGSSFRQDVPCVKVVWCDGHVTEEIASKMAPYYEVISHETR